jgi:hypothetical protein
MSGLVSSNKKIPAKFQNMITEFVRTKNKPDKW